MLSRGFTIPIFPSYARLRGLVQPRFIPKSLPPGFFSELDRYQALGIKRYTLGAKWASSGAKLVKRRVIRADYGRCLPLRREI